jgi:hypothetical protein
MLFMLQKLINFTQTTIVGYYKGNNQQYNYHLVK